MHHHPVIIRHRDITSRRPGTIRQGQGRVIGCIPISGAVIIGTTVAVAGVTVEAVIMGEVVAGIVDRFFLETALNAPFFMGDRLS